MKRYLNSITGRDGQAVAGASVAVKDVNGNLATIYSDNGLTTKANPTLTDSSGAFFFYADDGSYTLTITSPGTIPQVLTGVVLQNVSDIGLDVQGFKLAAETSWDNAFARAIAYVVALATAASRTYGLPAIEMAGDHYNFTTGNIATFPWINFVAKGSVFLDFSAIPVANNGFICNNITTLPTDVLKQPGNSGNWLDGSGGAIAILGPGKGASTGSACKMGNFVAGGRPYRDAGRCNVVITGWGQADEWGNFDTYLCKTKASRLESNSTLVKFAGANTNSGERMVYEDCTLGGAGTVLSHNGVSYDLNFRNCSFDFNTALLVFGSSSQYCQITLDDCYFEAFDGYIVDGSALTGTADANQVVVRVNNLTALPRSSTGAQGVNSPSRPLFRGAFSLLLDGIKQRTEMRPYLEDGAAIESTVTTLRASGYHTPPYSGALRGDAFVNRDYDFQQDANGTLASALIAWDVVLSTSVTTADLFSVSSKKVMRLVGASGANTSAYQLRSKQSLPCRAGDIFWTNLCLNANGATGDVGTQAWVQFYDDAGNSVGILPAFARYVFRDALNDTALPNYASGNDRWMDTSAFRCVAPKNAVTAKMLWAVDSFDGTVYVSRARLWRDS